MLRSIKNDITKKARHGKHRFDIESKKKTSLSCARNIMTVVCEEEIHYFVCEFEAGKETCV